MLTFREKYIPAIVELDIAAHTSKASGAKASAFVAKAAIVAVGHTLFAVTPNISTIYPLVAVITKALTTLTHPVPTAGELAWSVTWTAYRYFTPLTFKTRIAETFAAPAYTPPRAVGWGAGFLFFTMFTTESWVAKTCTVPTDSISMAIMTATTLGKLTIATMETRIAVAQLFSISQDAIAIKRAI